jgi:hypothetical protein
LLGLPAMARYWMPVLLLPVLLVAWAFATVHRQGIERCKPGAKIAAPILLLIVLFATWLQSYAFGRLYADPQYDTRTRAGEWIAQNIPAGSSIGVLSDPWQFEIPPIDARKFRIIIIEDSPPEALDYFVASDLQNVPEVPRAGHSGRLYYHIEITGPSPARLKLFNWLALTGCTDIVQQFKAWPTGLKDNLQYGPQDLRYTNPCITIAKRILKDSR